MKKFFSSRSRRERHEAAPLLGSGPDGSYVEAEVEQHGVSSRESSPAASIHNEQEPASPSRDLSLHFGPTDPPQPPSPKTQAFLDGEINVVTDLLAHWSENYSEAKKNHKATVKEIAQLQKQYVEERAKNPEREIMPKGTWFTGERKALPRRKEEHEAKVRDIHERLEMAMMVDEPEDLRLRLNAKSKVRRLKAELAQLRRRRMGYEH